MGSLVVYNGKILGDKQVPISFNNRAFKYGDAVFETIRTRGQYPLHFQKHYKRLIKAMLSLSMEIASLPKEDELHDDIVKLLKKKAVFSNSRVRIEVFREGEGLYTPVTNKVNYLIETTELATKNYQLNEKGLLVSVYKSMKKSYSPVSFFKNANALHYVLAALNKAKDNVNDCLIINEKDRIIEASSSNLFWIKGNEVFTPAVSTGCVDGVMRSLVLEIIKKHTHLKVVENLGAQESDLLNADEIFLTNAIQGIQWVMGIYETRFFNQQTKKISELLNKSIQH